MNAGMLLALAAAVSFGCSDTLAALVSRRLGALRTGAMVLSVSLVALLAYGALNPPSIPGDVEWLARVFGLGCLTGIAYLSLVNALRLGPVVVVSPLGATVGGMSVLLAVVLLGSRPSAFQWVGVFAAAAGSVLVALVPEGGRVRLTGRGPVFALIAMAGYATSIVGLQDPIRFAGWLPTLIVWRTGNVLVAGVVLLAWRGRVPDTVPATRSGDTVAALPGALPTRNRHAAIAGVVLTGLLETAGQVLRAQGLAVAPAWIVGLLGSLAPVIVIGAGVLILGERLARSQWAGIGLAAAGVVILAVT